MRKIELKRHFKDRCSDTIRTSGYTFHCMDMVQLYTHGGNIRFRIGEMEEIAKLEGDDWEAIDLLSPVPGIRRLAEDWFKREENNK